MKATELFKRTGWRLGDHVILTGYTVSENDSDQVVGLRFSQPGRKELIVGAKDTERGEALRLRVEKF